MSIKAVVVVAGQKAEVQAISKPCPSPSELLVKVHAAALNPTDWKHVKYISKPGVVSGCDFAGVVEGVGSGVNNFKVGDRVAGLVHGGDSLNGSFAEYCTAEASITYKIPDHVTFAEASTLGVGAGTAAMALFYHLGLPTPEKPATGNRPKLLVWGASGSVGHFAVQLGKLAGLRVVATASPASHENILALGAEKVFDYRDPEVSKKILEWAGNDLTFGLDAISENNTVPLASNSMTGGKLVLLLGQSKDLAENNKNVQMVPMMYYTALGKPFTKMGFTTPAFPEHKKHTEWWAAYLTKLLQEKKLVFQKITSIGGLEKFQVGFDNLEAGKAKAEKYVLECGGQIHRHVQKLTEEYGTLSNIKSKKTRLAVQSAIVSLKERLKQYNTLPPNGLALFSGICDPERVCTAIHPFKPLTRSYYLCDKVFHTEFLQEMLTSNESFGFIIMDGNGYLFAALAGTEKRILSQLNVDLPNKHGRGGQSQNRFERLRDIARQNFVAKTAEKANDVFLSEDKCNVSGIIIAGNADFKSMLMNCGKFDQRIKEKVLKIVDISYGGRQGLKEAINLSSELLSNVKIVNEVALLKKFFGEITLDNAKICFGIKDTVIALEAGAVETLIVYGELDMWRVVRSNQLVSILSNAELESDALFDGQGEITEKKLLVEWLSEHFVDYGCKIELVTDKSQEGSQFVRGIGGIGAILRYAMNFEQFEDEYYSD
ncbi:Polypeptide release factor (eRF1) in translation termination [Terramyces sp. JEL0728]|nr:Polypeptide release factor (eRF1) in translation termination [Terramyces sp. JEL0728]